MEMRIAELRGMYDGDREALAILEQLAEEPEMHRRHSDCHAYEFFVVRRTLRQSPSGLIQAFGPGAPESPMTHL